MDINALVIAPYKGLMELTASLKEELKDFRITTELGNLSEALPLVAHINEGGYDVIISRGGTARLLRRHTDIPVIEVHVTGYDIMRILTLVKDYTTKVEMIGFPNVIEGFISVSRIMGIDFAYTVINHEDEVGRAILKARQSGVSIVLGDTITVLQAQEQGLEGVLITSGREAVLEAFAQARHMQAVVRRHRQKSSMYEKLMDLQEVGLAVIDKHCKVRYANRLFHSQWSLPQRRVKEEAVLRYPNLTAIVGCLEKGMVFDGKLAVYEPSRAFAISAGPIPSEAGDGLYYLKTDARTPLEVELKIRFSAEEMQSFPLSIPPGPSRGEGPNEAGGPSFPVALYGENGSGKRLWAERLVSGDAPQRSLFMEIELSQMSDGSFEGLRNILLRTDRGMTILLKGIELAGLSYQKQLPALLERAEGRWILSFERDPGILVKEGVLDTGIFGLIRDRRIYFPPLRERGEDLEALVRSFIAKSNEMMGKQVVGIRPSVLDALKRYSWQGNLLELKDTIELFVREADGEYIEDKALERLGNIQPSRGSRALAPAGNGINLNQTLENIERDVIMAVLEEEQMNQSKAAKRLGINRSTLWRKLKQEIQIE